MADPTLVPVALTQRGLMASQPAIVSGCVDPVLVADYTRAVAVEYRAKGFGIGLFIGAAACIAVAVYVKSKGA